MKTLIALIFLLSPFASWSQVIIPTTTSTNTFTNKAIDGASNTLTNIANMDVQSFAPAAGATIKPTNNGRNILAAINPAATIATLTFNFPDAPSTGQIVTLSSSQIVTVLTLGNGTILNTITTLALGGYAAFAYDGTQWRRVQ